MRTLLLWTLLTAFGAVCLATLAGMLTLVAVIHPLGAMLFYWLGLLLPLMLTEGEHAPTDDWHKWRDADELDGRGPWWDD